MSEYWTESTARAKCEEAAAMAISKHVPGGHWQWLDDTHLRVYKADGDAFITLTIEGLQ